MRESSAPIAGLDRHGARERPRDDAVAGLEALAAGRQQVGDQADRLGQVDLGRRRLPLLAGDGDGRDDASDGGVLAVRPEDDGPVEHVARQSLLQVVGRPGHVDQLDRRSQRFDRGERLVHLRAGTDITPELDGDLDLHERPARPGERVRAVRPDLGGAGQKSDHGLAKTERLLRLRGVEPDLPAAPLRALAEQAAPLLELALEPGLDARVDLARGHRYGVITILSASRRS